MICFTIFTRTAEKSPRTPVRSICLQTRLLQLYSLRSRCAKAINNSGRKMLIERRGAKEQAFHS